MKKAELLALQQQAALVRTHVLRQIRMSGSGHLAGSLSCADIITFLYFHALQLKPEEPTWPERDLFYLSAGHLCPAWYAALCCRGYFSPELLLTLRQFGSPLQGHPRRDVSLGIENTAGSLGQGLSLAVGSSLALKNDKSKRRVVVLSTDGEQQEGQVWEAYQAAAHYKLKNLTVLIDANGIQQSGPTKEVMNVEQLATRLEAFKFKVAVCSGHDFKALEKAWKAVSKSASPRAIVCQTTPGKGIELLENDYHWHATLPDENQWPTVFAQMEQVLTEAQVEFAKGKNDQSDA